MKIPTPYYAYVHVILTSGDGKSIDLGNLPPSSVRGLEVTRIQNGTPSSMKLHLFDESAIIVEYYLVTGYDNIQISWGYTGGDSSFTYVFIASTYQLMFYTEGADLEISGVGKGSYSDAVNNQSVAKTYTGERYSDIVKQVFEDAGWSYSNSDIEPTKVIPGGITLSKSADQSYSDFIMQVIVPNSVSASDDQASNYQFNIKSLEDGDHAYFTSIGYANKTNKNYEFTWGMGIGNTNSKVINFVPSYIGVSSDMGGGSGVVMDSVDPDTMEMNETTVVPVSADNPYVRSHSKPVKIGGSSYNVASMISIQNYMMSRFSYSIQATLTIVGDPTLSVNQTITISVLNKYGVMHHTSGTYQIIKIIDNIENGTYTTQLELQRKTNALGIETDVQNDAVASNNGSSYIYGNGQDNTSLLNGSKYADALSGNGNTDIVTVAQGELGNNESDGSADKYVHDVFSKDSNSRATPWCACFVSWCANQANISSDTLVRTASCDSFYTWFQQHNILHQSIHYGGVRFTPKAGDIILFYSSKGTGQYATHVGIVESSDGSTVTYISGNSSNKVMRNTLNLDASYIRAFGSPLYRTAELNGGLAQDPASFYTKVSGVGETTDKTIAGVKLFSGLPWSGNAYRLDNSKVKDYISKSLGQSPTMSVAVDDYCKAYPTVDGVGCISAVGYPIMAFCNINQYGISEGWGSYYPRKFAAVLKSRSDGNTYYLPCSCQAGKGYDYKGHTWPGGVCQTFLSNTNNTYNNGKYYFNTDGGYITGSIVGQYVNYNQIKSGYSSVKYNGSKVFPQINLEVNSKVFNDINKHYDFEGYVVWR